MSNLAPADPSIVRDLCQLAQSPPFMLREPTVIKLTALPPSVNNMFVNVRGKGRVRSDKYKAWAHAAGWELKFQRPASIKGPVRVTIILEDTKGRDADNTAKPVLDLLVYLKIIEADDSSIVREVTAKWCLKTKGCRVELEAV